MAAEAVVSAVVDQLASVGADWLKEEISLIKDVKPELDNMKDKMKTIQTVLEDAENQSVKRDNVKSWLKELQDVSYDMDDVLDEWSTRVHMLEREMAEAGKFTCFFLKELNCFSFVKQLRWRRDVALRIKSINKRVNSLSSKMKDIELASNAVRNDDIDKIINSKDIVRTTTSSIDEPEVLGRVNDKKSLLEKVLAKNTVHEKSLKVISIVGPGGLGKTTLAQRIYNDESVEQKFRGKRIWVCVSNPFDEVKVARAILEGLQKDHTKMNNLQTLHQSIETSLSKVKFLLVLDDVWDEDSSKWNNLSKCLKVGHPNSRVLVTTRNQEVAITMGTTPSNILKPGLISDLDCWLLMKQGALQGRTDLDNDELEDIGKEIAKKCKGLPLAAKTLGGLLRSKDSIQGWKEVLHSDIWKLEKVEIDLFQHIYLSYQELPSVLKRCFLISAIFPKDTKLKFEEVIGLWMAHGFLNQQTGDMVKTGKNYLEFLVSRSFLEEKDSLISMQDIMHDFALYLSRDELISVGVHDKIENDSGSKSTSESDWATARHLYIEGNIDRTSVGSVEKLHTYMIRNVATNVTLDLVKCLKMVRALYLVRCGLTRVPQSIEKLIHLRLLDLSHNPLDKLPKRIGGLYNLQQLYLISCGLSTLPDSIGKLTNLLFLRTEALKLPKSVGKLINLQYFREIYEVEAGKSTLGFLKDLNQLGGKLEIEFKSEYVDEVDVKKASIQKKKHITELLLDFNHHEVAYDVITALQPPSNIQFLRIYGLLSSSLPCWITSLHHLTELEINDALNISTLPPLGEIRSLRKLSLCFFKALKMIGREVWGIDEHENDEVYVAFPSLLELMIRDCNLLEEWSDIKAEDEGKVKVMPKLQTLKIELCEKLQMLPSRLLCRAASLEVLSCKDNNSSLGEYIKNEQQLLGRVKNVKINGQQCSLQPLIKSDIEKSTINSTFLWIVIVVILLSFLLPSIRGV